ncbi:undecaprenyl phosphate translocase family protein [Clostridium formicaceticum]|uniref:DUF368 domain-containing protein n=1 Tax=Clostridium formicaceticum TaxID=1497 RepID=A0AAC9WFJ0_9CLOT|nr:DUF368 domain-containing protein [Clostridium formicaceticum]AOY76398.1 DUF368 domain-containing protein [Clostridium formicaceticum]ARE86791.1 hypothetical protein CLFO_11220 [Clostridium formicaceticum]
MNLMIKGIILGCIIVLPGMSGGTVFLIFGIYENMLKDLAKLNIKPYLPLLAGSIIGIFISGMLFALFFESFRDETAVFLMGCLIASIRPVLKPCEKLNLQGILFFLGGLVIGYYMGGEPIGLMVEIEEISWILLMIGGILSSAAMIIPGIPGSSVLIVLGIYDSILYSIKELELFNLIIFGIGSIIGIFLLINILNNIYEKYRSVISYFFAGLILGSSRALLPYSFKPYILLIFAVGFILVWIWSGKQNAPADELQKKDEN